MIVVLADDLSGAAELAGAAARRGLKAEVQTEFVAATPADVVALDTDTRSLPMQEAADRVGAITRHVVRSRPSWIYKKVDSVLRGHIQAELGAILQATGSPRALLIPANPSRHRVIRNGVCLVEGRELAETVFARDPEFPATTSRVLPRLQRCAQPPLHQVGRRDPVGPDGITVPDVESLEEIDHRAATLDRMTLPAGGVDFFKALLKRRAAATGFPGEEICPMASSLPTLLVCGSAAAIDGGRLEECRGHGFAVSRMPESLFAGRDGGPWASAWAEEVLAQLNQGRNVLLTVGRSASETPACPAGELIKPLAETAASALRQSRVGRLMVEGGATAVALLRAMTWTRLQARWQEPLPWFEIPDRPGLRLWIKPGSYPWPIQAWSPDRT